MTRQRRPSPAASGPFPSALFSHRLWLLGLLVMAGSVLVGCGDGPTGGGALPPPAAPPPPPSPDMIAFHSGRDGNFEIYVMNADGTNPTRLTNNPAFDALPAWSPDGTKIAFFSDRDGNGDIYVMNADGTNPT